MDSIHDSKMVQQVIERESADFASQVHDVIEDGNGFCKSTMVVVIDELLNDLISHFEGKPADQAAMLHMVIEARQTLKGVMRDESGEAA
jgi:hypothetical protein